MKKKIYIAIVLLLPVLLLLSACEGEVKGVRAEETETRALLEVNLGTTVDEDNKEKIKTVRFIVFKNATDNFNAPLVFNELKEYTDEEIKSATELTATLKVPYNDDLMVVAILNEPDGLAEKLAGISSKYALENLQFSMGVFDTYLVSKFKDKFMPMTGVNWAGKIHLKEEGKEGETAETLTIHVVRAFARVDLYLQNESDAMNVKLGKKIVFNNIVTRKKDAVYLATGSREDQTRFNKTDAYKNFGLPPSASSDIIASDASMTNTNFITLTTTPKLIASLYMPERAYTFPGNDESKDATNPFGFGIELIFNDDETTPYAATLNLAKATKKDEQTATTLTGIERNNHYTIVGTVTERGILTVVDWDDSIDPYEKKLGDDDSNWWYADWIDVEYDKELEGSSL